MITQKTLTSSPLDKTLIEIAFVDSDPIAYAGACICEKACYQWVKNGTDVKSEKFKSAADAKEFAEVMEMQGENMEDWTREKGVILGTKEDAEKAVDGVVKDYMDTAIKLSGNPDIDFTGYLTESGTPKIKDIEGLENKYQGNRDPNAKPSLLGYCRDYLQETYPWVIMAAKGFEADTHIVAKCEQLGEKALGMFIDKDLAQMEDGLFVDMKRPRSVRCITSTTSLGDLWIETNARGKESVKGHGFKWVVFQAMVGDTADGYKGLNGFGEKAGLKLLSDPETKEEVMQAALTHYTKKLKKGILCKKAKELGAKPIPEHICYLSWDGKRVKLDARGLLNQHLFLAYQERGATDSLKVEHYV